MRVKVKFLTQTMKNGVLQKPGDILEIDASAAILLALKNTVEIPGYEIKKVKREIEVNTLIPKEADK